MFFSVEQHLVNHDQLVLANITQTDCKFYKLY